MEEIKSIVIEAAELLECFQWDNEKYDLEHVKEELADVIVYCQDMLDRKVHPETFRCRREFLNAVELSNVEFPFYFLHFASF